MLKRATGRARNRRKFSAVKRSVRPYKSIKQNRVTMENDKAASMPQEDPDSRALGSSAPSSTRAAASSRRPETRGAFAWRRRPPPRPRCSRPRGELAGRGRRRHGTRPPGPRPAAPRLGGARRTPRPMSRCSCSNTSRSDRPGTCTCRGRRGLERCPREAGPAGAMAASSVGAEVVFAPAAAITFLATSWLHTVLARGFRVLAVEAWQRGAQLRRMATRCPLRCSRASGSISSSPRASPTDICKFAVRWQWRLVYVRYMPHIPE
jgi:hypothetical protein